MRNISIQKNYSTENSENINIYNSDNQYNINKITIEDSALNELSSQLVLPNDIDIFSELPNSIYENNDVKDFLNYLKKALLDINRSNLTFSKLFLSEYNDTTMTFEWIFNYFRTYFSFDDDGSIYGLCSYQPDQKSMFNFSKPLVKEQYNEIAQLIVDFVVKRLRT